jgi:hypothetical protein
MGYTLYKPSCRQALIVFRTPQKSPIKMTFKQFFHPNTLNHKCSAETHLDPCSIISDRLLIYHGDIFHELVC